MTAGLVRYKRVAQRMREQFQDSEFGIQDLEDAIFIECGTDKRTVQAAIDRMLRLKLLLEVDKVREFGVMPARKFKLSHTQDEYL